MAFHNGLGGPREKFCVPWGEASLMHVISAPKRRVCAAEAIKGKRVGCQWTVVL